MAKIITVFNQKGGPGKTSVTMLLAGYWIGLGFEVIVIDTDTQGSSTKWESRPNPDYPQHPARVDKLIGDKKATFEENQQMFAQNVKKRITSKTDFVLVDTPPRLDSVELATALYVADAAIMPMVPDILHVDALEEVMALLDEINAKRIRKGSPKLPVGLILNKVKGRRKNHIQLADMAEEISGFPVIARLADLTAYEAAANMRTTLVSVTKPSDPARKELATLGKAVEGFVKKALEPLKERA